MARLWEVAYYARKTIRYSTIGLMVLIVGRVIVGVSIDLYKKYNPPPPPAPTVGFAKLPALTFPKQKRPEVELRLETISGTVETPNYEAKVYLMPITRPNLLGLERGSQIAANLGFLFEPEALTAKLYRFVRTTPIPARLDYDIVTGNFKMRMDWFDQPNFLEEKFLPDEKQAVTEVRNYLNKADLLAEDIENGAQKVMFLGAKGKSYQAVDSLSEADFIQVDLFRQPIETELPVVTPIKDKGIIRVILTGSRVQNQRVAQVEYDYFPVDSEVFETYPIKSGQAAWQELVTGGGYIVSSPSEGALAIRKTYLAYYDAFDPQNYFQPVYVFEGDEEFMALVPAVDPAWIQESLE
jgi:hypothetical protein